MRVLAGLLLMSISGVIYGQGKDYSTSQALRIVKNNQEADAKEDSSRNLFKDKWTLNVGFGNRYILGKNISDQADTTLFADFSKLSGSLNLGAGKFLSRRLWLNSDITIALPKRDQDITSITFGTNGITAEGKGSGGLMIGFAFVGKYYMKEWEYSRLYVGGGIGGLNLMAKGGELSFSSANGQSIDVAETRASYLSKEILAGITFRPSKTLLFDAEFGYNFTTKDEPVGRIISPGGFTTAFTLSFIINANRY